MGQRAPEKSKIIIVLKRNSIMKLTAREIKEAMNIPQVGIDTKSLQDDRALAEQGVDSLDMMNMMLAIEEKFGGKVSDAEIADLHTINDILLFLNKTR
jgi:acyl carrier protein